MRAVMIGGRCELHGRGLVISFAPNNTMAQIEHFMFSLNEERFWAKVAKTNGCWNWSGCLNHGYGWLGMCGRTHLAHKVSWVLTYGPIAADGLRVAHTCTNRRCVNPAHLSLGTASDYQRGEKGPRAILTEEQVRLILSKPQKYGSDKTFVQQFGVSRSTISMIRRGKSWCHITAPKTSLPDS